MSKITKVIIIEFSKQINPPEMEVVIYKISYYKDIQRLLQNLKFSYKLHTTNVNQYETV